MFNCPKSVGLRTGSVFRVCKAGIPTTCAVFLLFSRLPLFNCTNILVSAAALTYSLPTGENACFLTSYQYITKSQFSILWRSKSVKHWNCIVGSSKSDFLFLLVFSSACCWFFRKSKVVEKSPNILSFFLRIYMRMCENVSVCVCAKAAGFSSFGQSRSHPCTRMCMSVNVRMYVGE